jgi:hypothetical protein
MSAQDPEDAKREEDRANKNRWLTKEGFRTVLPSKASEFRTHESEWGGILLQRMCSVLIDWRGLAFNRTLCTFVCESMRGLMHYCRTQALQANPHKRP